MAVHEERQARSLSRKSLVTTRELCPTFRMCSHVESENFIRRKPGFGTYQLRLAQGVKISHAHGLCLGVQGYYLCPVARGQEYPAPYGQLCKIHRILLIPFPVLAIQ